MPSGEPKEPNPIETQEEKRKLINDISLAMNAINSYIEESPKDLDAKLSSAKSLSTLMNTYFEKITPRLKLIETEQPRFVDNFIKTFTEAMAYLVAITGDISAYIIESKLTKEQKGKIEEIKTTFKSLRTNVFDHLIPGPIEDLANHILALITEMEIRLADKEGSLEFEE